MEKISGGINMRKIIVLSLAWILIISLAGSLGIAAQTVKKTTSTETTCQNGSWDLVLY